MSLSVAITEPLNQGIRSRCEERAQEGFMESLSKSDSTLWGESAQAEASIRLGWTADPRVWSDLASEVAEVHRDLMARGINRVVLCGMGGSSLGPEVIAATHNLPLTIVDSTHPDEVSHSVNQDLSATVVVVSSKSGGTVETDSQKRAFEGALRSQGLDPAGHMVVVSDPGSPLSISSLEAGYRVFDGDPTIGGRFSVLSPFGLVPAGLAGLDLARFLEAASEGYDQCITTGPDNPALMLGVALAQGNPQVNKILYRSDPKAPGFGDWVEQLVAESTGKDGVGILPVVESSLERIDDGLSVGPSGSNSDIEVSGSIAHQMVLWEYATAVAGAELGVNPFDQPNVESAKVAARELLTAPTQETRVEDSLEGLSVFTSAPATAPASLSSIPSLLGELAGPHGYIALCVFGPRESAHLWRGCADALERATGRPVTVGFGPRFLHSTGQLHKGGAPEGVFLHIIQTPQAELEIPGRDFDFWQLLLAQAHGDAEVLARSGQPVLSLTGEASDVTRVREALQN